MGWWSTNTNGVSFAKNDEEEMLWGDSVADTMDDALDKIVKIFKEDVGRLPTKDEVFAGLKFSTSTWD